MILPVVFLLSWLLLLGLWPMGVMAGEGGLRNPIRLGVGLTAGHSYDPVPTFDFYQLTWVLQYDYDQVWPHQAPEPLFFKVEGSLGLADYLGDTRMMISVNMLAQYYLAGLNTGPLRPYLEAGIGLIFTDFQVDGQGLRLNFNPLAGIGCDLKTDTGTIWFSGFRIHHLSNGELHHDNRGINSVLLQIGRYF